MPVTPFSSVAGSAASGTSISSASATSTSPRGGGDHGVDDLDVAGASADVPAQRLDAPRSRVTSPPPRSISACAAIIMPRGAEPALGGVRLMECGLNGREIAGGPEALDRGDLSPVDRGHREQAGAPRLAVDEDGAGSAAALLAARLRAQDARAPRAARAAATSAVGWRSACVTPLTFSSIICLLAAAPGLGGPAWAGPACGTRMRPARRRAARVRRAPARPHPRARRRRPALARPRAAARHAVPTPAAATRTPPPPCAHATAMTA